MWDLDVFAGSGAGCRNLISGFKFVSSIENTKSANESKFTSFCESVELASEVLYVLCKYADFFLFTAQTNVFFCIFDAKIGTSANLKIRSAGDRRNFANAYGHGSAGASPLTAAPPQAHTRSR